MLENGFLYDFGEGCTCAEVHFTLAHATPYVVLRIDAPDGDGIGVIPLSSRGNENVAKGQIAKVSGEHKVFFELRGRTEITSISFDNSDPYACEYTPLHDADNSYTDSWEAVDMLGRHVASVEDVGKKTDRKVGIFYWTWRDSFAGRKPVNVTKMLAEYPAAEYNQNHPAWGGTMGEIQCHWNEPLYGFYKIEDPYIVRHHASMLAAAGVDFIAFDCTNGSFLWREAYEPLFEEFYKAKKDGIRVPKVAFILNFGPMPDSRIMLRALYQNLYKKGLYSDMWFRIDGKPMIMAYPECVEVEGVCREDTELLKEIREFFTFRPPQPLYGRADGGPHRPDHWGWLEIFPQNKYGERADGSCEMMTVGVGQNANDERICTCFNDKGTYGRSYTKKYGHKLLDENSYKYGYNIQEQWDRAIDIDPDYVFVTGWNEWIMGPVNCKPWITDNNSTKLAMVDQYSRECSRDIEPDKDGYLDTYYLQLASNIRRYKGCSPRQKTSEKKTIDIYAGVSEWNDVTPVYKNHKGTKAVRDHVGFAGTYYKNDSGVNDIIEARVSRDDENLYMLVKCSEKLVRPMDEGMMTVLIDTDRNKETGWEGYDYRINGLSGKKNSVSVEKYLPTADKKSFSWEKIGECEASVKNNALKIKIPRALVGLQGKLNFEFKISDNMQQHDIMDFYVNGCVAPIGRFNYLYKE